VSSLFVHEVAAGYGAVQALHGVSLQVRHGETVALFGTNGNGKSTLLKCIMGLVPLRGGRIELRLDDGQKVRLDGLKTQDIVDLGVALVPEGRRLFPRMTVEETLYLGAYRRLARAEVQRNLALCYETFPVLAERRAQLAGTMSGGQQQMLALARALMSSPRLLLVDEPSVGLSPLLVSQTIEKIGQLKAAQGLTVLMAEQNFHQTVRIADRGYVIVHGEIAFEGADTQALTRNETIQSLYLGQA
jgi:branched-chain amino acid transport system ATP-binding protein